MSFYCDLPANYDSQFNPPQDGSYGLFNGTDPNSYEDEPFEEEEEL